MPAFPNATSHPGLPYEEVQQVIKQQISAIFGPGFMARNATHQDRAIVFDIPPDFFHEMLKRAIDGNVVTDQRGNGTARLTGRKEFTDTMNNSWQKAYHMQALQSTKEYIKSHLKPYARQISPTLGIPTIEWAVHVADHLWHIFWDYTQQEQLGVDWAELEKQVAEVAKMAGEVAEVNQGNQDLSGVASKSPSRRSWNTRIYLTGKCS